MSHSRAQIVATIGPATRSIHFMRVLIESGVDVVRINFAHETLEDHRHTIHNTRIAAAEQEKYVPIIGDLAGPQKDTQDIHAYNSGALSIITEDDQEAIDFCIEQNVDYVGLSFVGNTYDIEDLRRSFWERNANVRIIANIERIEALRNLEGIAQAADGVVLARGALGSEVPLEQIPFIQSRAIKTLNWAHKPIVIATETLTTMKERPRPTRAEVSDIAYAIIDGADAVMLHEETAIGSYPVEAVQMTERIILEAERHTETQDVHLL